MGRRRHWDLLRDRPGTAWLLCMAAAGLARTGTARLRAPRAAPAQPTSGLQARAACLAKHQPKPRCGARIARARLHPQEQWSRAALQPCCGTSQPARRPHRPPTSAGSAAAAAPRARPAGRAAAAPSPGRAGPAAARPARLAPSARAPWRSAPSPRHARPRAGRLRERGPPSARAKVRVCSRLPHATLQWRRAGAAPPVGRARCAPLTGMPCSMTRTKRPPPVALQKVVRYAACGPLPAALSFAYRHALLYRCCGRPQSTPSGAACKRCWTGVCGSAHPRGQRERALALFKECSLRCKLARRPGGWSAGQPHEERREAWAVLRQDSGRSSLAPHV